MASLREFSICKLATVTGIDAKAVATTELYEVPAGYALVVDHVVIRVTAFTVGSKGVQAIASFGGNSATYDDFLNSVTYTVAAASKAIIDGQEDTAIPIYAAGASFRISVETGSDATAETWAVDVFGYLVTA
jgi:hypothetical protein